MTSKKTQKKRKPPAKKVQGELVFALDIGTRSIIGIVGKVEGDLFKVLAIESEEHSKRSMKDGQIENIEQVAQVAQRVKKRLESKLHVTLKKVCIAAAGRALRTQKASYEMQLEQTSHIDGELIGRLEIGAVTAAEEAFHKESSAEDEELGRGFFLVGYSVLSYYLDNLNISSLMDHKGKTLKAEVIATFLPREVVDSLYMTMQKCGLDVVSMTLEPIAAINAAIPKDLRLLNLALIDIGAGTSDIAVCRDGAVTGYTMATVAGDEITEVLMKQFLVDFQTAEQIKMQYAAQESLSFTNILGLEETVSRAQIEQLLTEPIGHLAGEIVKRVTELNNGAPSAVFLAGGGSKLAGLKEAVSEKFNMDAKRVAIAGGNFRLSAFSDQYDLNNPEYTTPLGIAVSSGLRLLQDSLQILLNGKPAKIFKSGTLKVIDVLMMNGYVYSHILGHSGKSVTVMVEGEKKVFYGERAIPAILKLNGVDASISDTVQVGDRVDFKSAVSGQDAQPTAAECLPDGISTEEWDICINGEIAAPETGVKNGDELSFRKRVRIETAQPLQTQSEPEAETAPTSAAPVSVQPAQAETAPTVQPAPAIQSAQPHMPEMPTAHAAQGLSPETLSETQQAAVQTTGGMQVTLNDKPLTLPPKTGGEPYYLMDLLEFSNLDFDNLNASVSLRVNGEESGFLQEIRHHDVIEIKSDENLAAR